MLIFHLDFNHVRLGYEFVKDLLDKAALLRCDAILWELIAPMDAGRFWLGGCFAMPHGRRNIKHSSRPSEPPKFQWME